MIKRNFTCKTCFLTNLFLVILLGFSGFRAFSQAQTPAKLCTGETLSTMTAVQSQMNGDYLRAIESAGRVTNNASCFYIVKSRLPEPNCFVDSKPLYEGLESVLFALLSEENTNVFYNYPRTFSLRNTLGVAENRQNAGQQTVIRIQNCLLPGGILAAISQPECVSGIHFRFRNAFTLTAKEAGTEAIS